ncbi:NAD-dependent epimerase/dehydratase family protein [Thermodesulfobacteriota bacterium]
MERSFEGKRILLIGGAGFIGHNLALRFKELGADVGILDSLQVNNFLSYLSFTENNQNQDLYMMILNQRLKLLKEAKIPLHIQDCRDYHGMQRYVEEIKPQVIVHLAAVAHANKSNRDPYSTFDHSFRTLENALDCARDGVEHFIYFSSSMIYGNFEGGMVTEESPCEPLGIYGALKFGGEKLVIAYNQVFDIPYTIIRPSALYGERCVSRRVGQIFIENAIQGLDISISGDGSDRLDFTYIGDLVEGMVRVVRNENSHNQIFNLTYGDSRSLSDMAAIIEDQFPNVDIKYTPKDKLMPDRGTLSVEKATKLIGYEPSWPLEKGFVKYINWYKEITKEFGGTGKVSLIYG